MIFLKTFIVGNTETTTEAVKTTTRAVQSTTTTVKSTTRTVRDLDSEDSSSGQDAGMS